MNSFVAVGKVSGLEQRETKLGKSYYSFVLLVPVRGGPGIELELKKFCSYWPRIEDKNVDNLKEGAHVIVSGYFEGYEKVRNDVKIVYERLKVNQIGTVVPPLQDIVPPVSMLEDEVVPIVDDLGDANEDIPIPF
jgi:hypothetical protein